MRLISANPRLQRQRPRDTMPIRCCEFVDSRLRRSPPDRASAVSYGQAGANATRFPHLAHRSAAAHKLHRTNATTRYEFDSGEGETFSRQPALAYSPRKLSKQPEPSQPTTGKALSTGSSACRAPHEAAANNTTPVGGTAR